jgi:prepilin-type N-terminal cleavage/methylation domain-containing protein
MRQVLRHKASARRRGFTLIELVVVLMVLAIVSGLVVALAGWVRRSANYGAASHNQSSVMANLELYRTTYGNNNYPDRFDSLLKSDGTVPSYIDSELAGMITPTACSADDFACLNNSGRGIKTIMHHVDPIDNTVVQGNPGNSGNISQTFASGDKLAYLNTSNTTAQKLLATIYPDGLPSDVKLVLMGVGPSCSANGRTMQSPPFYTNVDPSKTYNRFIAVFAVYSPREGRRAQLKAVLSSRGRTQNENISEFWQSANPD